MRFWRLFCTGGLCLLLTSQGEPLRAEPLLLDDAGALVALENSGFAFSRVVSREDFDVIATAVKDDVAELRAGLPSDSPRRTFDPSWLDRGRFELIGVANRIDRRAFEVRGCGEARLIYRLALKNPKRPGTRLPMTVNVRIPQPMPDGADDCGAVTRRWTTRAELVPLLERLPPFTKVEINFQSVHVPATRTDMDDHAEYILRAFRREGGRLVVDALFNTPRTDLDPSERRDLASWVAGHVPEIDAGTAVVPDRFLAPRAVSVSPRGLARVENAVFSRALGDERAAFESLPLAGRARVATPELLGRRLDEMTCPGCHQTATVAGFHLLGGERRGARAADALAIGRSPHLSRDLAWRADDLRRAALGVEPIARPFAAHPQGREGDECGIAPGFESFRCAPGLMCRDVHGAALGICATPAGGRPGQTCEDVRFEPNERPEGPIVTPSPPDPACPRPEGDTETAFCAPNWLGFTGGMCSRRCAAPGEVRDAAICARLPSAGYEADCLQSREPIERCLERHLVSAFVARCDDRTPCRGDYACASVEGAPAGVGACIPPYFLFQARVDGPLLDR